MLAGHKLGWTVECTPVDIVGYFCVMGSSEESLNNLGLVETRGSALGGAGNGGDGVGGRGDGGVECGWDVPDS